MRRVNSLIYLVVSTLLFIGSTTYSQKLIGDTEDINQILENTRKFSEYVMNDNYEMIGRSYTDDAKIFPNNTLIIKGRDSITTYWKHPQDIRITHHKITQEEIKVIGDEAYDYGYYEGATQKADGSVTKWKGKYVIVWRKKEGIWRMYLDMWNSVK